MMYPSEINVLIACEESQVEMMAFRAKGLDDLKKAVSL